LTWGRVKVAVRAGEKLITSVSLRHYEGAVWSTQMTTATDHAGVFSFMDVPSLGEDEAYSVQYHNPNGSDPADPSRVRAWFFPLLESYSAGETVVWGQTNIATVGLAYPAGTSLHSPLPCKFAWEFWNYRYYSWAPHPQDRYEYNLYDPYGAPWYYVDVGTAVSYTLFNLPVDFEMWTDYFWEVWIYDDHGGFGISRDRNVARFEPNGADDCAPDDWGVPSIASGDQDAGQPRIHPSLSILGSELPR
jgi:hypothetical protein